MKTVVSWAVQSLALLCEVPGTTTLTSGFVQSFELHVFLLLQACFPSPTSLAFSFQNIYVILKYLRVKNCVWSTFSQNNRQSFHSSVDVTSARPHRLNLKSVCIWNSDRARGLGGKKKTAKRQKTEQVRKQGNRPSKKWVCKRSATYPRLRHFFFLQVRATEIEAWVWKETDHKLRRKGPDFWTSSSRSPQTLTAEPPHTHPLQTSLWLQRLLPAFCSVPPLN